MNDKTRFYFGRLVFSQLTSLEHFKDIGTQDPSKAEKIRNTLENFIRTGEVIYSDEGDNWYFGQVKNTKDYIVGKFGKEFEDEKTGYDEEEGDFVEQPGSDASYSWFAIDPSQEVIMFNRKKRVGHKKFRKAFTQGYNEYIGSNILRIEFIKDKRTFEQVRAEADRVKRTHFELEPTNPGPTEEMEELDEHIRGMNADEFEMGANSETTLDLDESLLRGGIAMALAEEDYGDLDMEYIKKDGTKASYTSQEGPAKHKTDTPESIDDLVGIVEDLLEIVSNYTQENESGEDD